VRFSCVLDFRLSAMQAVPPDAFETAIFIQLAHEMEKKFSETMFSTGTSALGPLVVSTSRPHVVDT